MPNIAQQDYIIIDWEGKYMEDAAKLAEVREQLQKLFSANPLSLLSVVFVNYAEDGSYSTIVGYSQSDGKLAGCDFYDYGDSVISSISFE